MNGFIKTSIIVWLCSGLLAQAQDVDPTVVIVKHRANALRADLDRAHEASKGNGTVHHFQNFNWSFVLCDTEQEGKRVKDNYKQNGLFEQADHPAMITVSRVPNDPRYPEMWGLQKIEAAGGWDVATSNDVIVAVIDTGIDFNHEDLRGNLWTGPSGEHGYSATNGVLVMGGQDLHSHGTHVAGTIGAVGNNGIGVPGINWRIQLIAFDFLGAAGSGSGLGAALCIDRMITLKKDGYNIRVSNNSWGHLGDTDELLSDAFTAASSAGILNVCAAGNNGADTDVIGHVPASLPIQGIVSVQASDQNDNRASFSNFGAQTTDILAPGINILSCRLGGGYVLFSGTSMASPHCAGVAAAMLGVAPSLSALQCKDVLLHPDSYDRTAARQNSTGGGRVNLRKALTNPLLLNPPPANNIPSITLDVSTNLISVPPGHVVTISASGTDPDGDDLMFSTGQRSRYMNGLGGLMSLVASDNLFDRDFLGNTYSITNLPSGREYAIIVRFLVSDGRGGGDSKSVTLWFEREPSLVRQLPVPTLTLQTNFAEFYPYGVLVSMPGVDGSEARASMSVANTIGLGRTASFPVNTAIPLYGGLVPGPNAYRAQVMDYHGNFVQSEQLRVDVGSALYTPNLKATVNTTMGPAPLNTVVDLRASNLGGRTFSFIEFEWFQPGVFFSFDPFNPIRTTTLSGLGLNALEYMATDTVTKMQDAYVVLYTVTPAGVSEPPPTNPPPPTLIAPASLAVRLSGTSQLNLSWLDRSTGETRQDIEVRTKAKGPWTAFRPLVTLPANVQTHSFTGQRGAQYEFRVKACKDSACSPFSNTASIRVR